MDNRYFKNNCPPLMQDARFITNYLDKRIIDQEIRNINKINNIYNYKQFLQDNAEQIISNERKITEQFYSCSVNCKTPLSNSN